MSYKAYLIQLAVSIQNNGKSNTELGSKYENILASLPETEIKRFSNGLIQKRWEICIKILAIPTELREELYPHFINFASASQLPLNSPYQNDAKNFLKHLSKSYPNKIINDLKKGITRTTKLRQLLQTLSGIS